MTGQTSTVDDRYPLTLSVLLTPQIREPLRRGIIDLCEAAHHTDFQRLFFYLGEGGRHVLAYRGDELVGHAVRTTRWAQPEGLPILKTAYIDAVTTAETVQGQGIGSAVMRRLAEEIYKEDYLLCALETDKAGFYTRLGWIVWPGALAGRGENGLIPTPDEAGHVLVLRTPKTPELNLNGLLTIEEQGRIW